MTASVQYGDGLVSYLFTALLATDEPPSATEAREYLLEGALFDTRPEITIQNAASALEASSLVLEWEVDRAELDEDAWFALHLWQAWVLGRSTGWIYAPGDGLFDAELQRICRD